MKWDQQKPNLNSWQPNTSKWMIVLYIYFLACKVYYRSWILLKLVKIKSLEEKDFPFRFDMFFLAPNLFCSVLFGLGCLFFFFFSFAIKFNGKCDWYDEQLATRVKEMHKYRSLWSFMFMKIESIARHP